jgi:hypothetical protein
MGTFGSYEGQREAISGLPHGKRVFETVGGAKYEGSFDHGKRSGYGIEWSLGGDKYEGMWKDDRKHGRGVHHFLAENEFKGGR